MIVSYDKYKGIATFNLGQVNQEISQYIMEDKNIDFTINISYKGSISMRGSNINDTDLEINKICSFALAFALRALDESISPEKVITFVSICEEIFLTKLSIALVLNTSIDLL